MAKKSEKPGEEKSPAELLMEEIANRKEGPLRLRDVRVFEFPKSWTTLARRSLRIVDVANATGLEDGQVRSAEKGENVRLHIAIKLAKFFGRPVEELFGEPVEVLPEELKKRAEAKAAKKAAAASSASPPASDAPLFEGAES